MEYNWTSYGDSKNPVIALIATSNGFEGEEGQKILRDRIDVLVNRGFCVKVPIYGDGKVVVQTDVSGRESSRISGTVTPAVDPETGANQVIDCIRFGWNVMPLMGGDSFERKIPLIAAYFKQNPEHKRPAVKIFGFSNSTFATILASRGICSFISTPFSSVFTRKGFEAQAKQLELVMKGENTEQYHRAILQDPTNSLNDLQETYHYPVNIGVIDKEIDHIKAGDNTLCLSVEEGNWSLGFEGFLQRTDKVFPLNYPYLLEKFLENHQKNPPKFIEMGNFATRLDGANGYANLNHDDAGFISINEANIGKLLQNQKKLKEDVAKIAKEKEGLEQKPNQSVSEQRSLMILSLIPQEVFEKSQGDQDFNRDDVIKILKAQNETTKIIRDEISQVAEKLNIPLILNTRNGHCANMSIVNGGLNSIRVQDGKVVMQMAGFPTRYLGQIKAQRLSGPEVQKV
jgi:hypothetical protein